MEELTTSEPVLLSLDRLEVHFLLTVLFACEEILTTLLAVQVGPPPLTPEAIGNIGTLARKIAAQAKLSR